MTRESAAAKARRLLTEGRVTVTRVDGDIARASDDGRPVISRTPERR